ncbi:hypothetical protein Poli38472_006073 [Pythium oligandrum]|uniref:25S rRNA (uridine-N(3))-methyltransferase BMT5-like domain-containing protein n=1 Tax=Pythium oligandrum TaxID=41045 RepID=A0A8K1CS89_PYTOL|nr:hypothetical protein Poli38472_006073 [Pythium oligandrum]|eukprot:TMW68605.1 hypothetical protein Poli38472_006073 [Pythium oligandrum]
MATLPYTYYVWLVFMSSLKTKGQQFLLSTFAETLGDWHRMKRKASGGGGSAAALRRGAKRQRDDDSKEKLYTASDVTLVLGDGDFSFSKGLVAHRGSGKNLFATSYDSESKVKSKYSNAVECIQAVRAAQGTVFHDVDATKLERLPTRIQSNGQNTVVPAFFKYIIFNFPHTGQQRVHINRALLLDFFESARGKLVKPGEVHITLKNRPPYSNWLVEDQAKAAGFVLKERRRFNIRLFPGYHHRTTDPQAKKFEAELCITYVFVVNRSKFPFNPTVPTPECEEVEQSEEIQEETEGNAPGNDVTKEAERPSKRRRKQSQQKHPDSQHTSSTKSQAPNSTPANQQKSSPSFSLWRPLHQRRGAW